MSNIIMPNAITKGRAMSYCSLRVQTPAATDMFDAASDWAACCAITIRRQRSGVPADEQHGLEQNAGNNAHKGREARTPVAAADTGRGRVAASISAPPNTGPGAGVVPALRRGWIANVAKSLAADLA